MASPSFAMYLAARVGRWSTTVIGRFYNGRDHSTVCHGIQRIEALREADPDFDVLLSELKPSWWSIANCRRPAGQRASRAGDIS